MPVEVLIIEDDNNVLRAIDPDYIVAGSILTQAFQFPGPGISVLIAEYESPKRFAQPPYTRFQGWRCATAHVAKLRSIESKTDDGCNAYIDVIHKGREQNPYHADVNAIVNGKEATNEVWKLIEKLSLRSEIASKFSLMPNVTIGEDT